MKNRAVERLVGLKRARLLVQQLDSLGVERIPAAKAAGRFTAGDIQARCSCPTLDASLKDGFAVRGRDISSACRERPVVLTLVGSVAAGGHCDITVKTGQAVRIMTGAPIPAGADAVLASEFADTSENQVLALADARPGRNILACGSDVTAGRNIIDRGTRMFPGHLGLLAAAGVAEIPVFWQPKVLIIATGSELAVPGEPIGPGQVAASNLVTLMAEVEAMGIHSEHLIIRDDLHLLQKKIAPLIEKYDVILTCGGVLDGDKDFTMQAMDNLDVEPVFHRVRVGPGKGVCLGMKDTTCIFNLPGGPPSNHVAFLLLAKPGIHRLGGLADPFTEYVSARLDRTLTGQPGWTQVFYGRLGNDGDLRTVSPLTKVGRLQRMAEADCLIELSEDQTCTEAGTIARKVWKTR